MVFSCWNNRLVPTAQFFTPGEWLEGTQWACALEVSKETFTKTQKAGPSLTEVVTLWWQTATPEEKRLVEYDMQAWYIMIYTLAFPKLF